jgi:hypothetical protein
VIAHLAVGMDDEIEALANELQLIEPVFPVDLVGKDGLTPVATGSDMVECAGEFEAQWSGHQPTVAAPRRLRWGEINRVRGSRSYANVSRRNDARDGPRHVLLF